MCCAHVSLDQNFFVNKFVNKAVSPGFHNFAIAEINATIQLILRRACIDSKSLQIFLYNYLCTKNSAIKIASKTARKLIFGHNNSQSPRGFNKAMSQDRVLLNIQNMAMHSLTHSSKDRIASKTFK